MNSPNPGRPTVATPASRVPIGSLAPSLAGTAPSVSTANALAAFDRTSLMNSSKDLKGKAHSYLLRIQAEEQARDISLRRAHLLMLSLGRDYKEKLLRSTNPSEAEYQSSPVASSTIDEIFEPFIEDLNEADNVYQRSLEQANVIAGRVEGSTHIAEASSTQVKRLDVLLSRVKDTQSLVAAMLQKKSQLAAMDAAMKAGNLESASAAVEAYEAAKLVVIEARKRRLTVDKKKRRHQGNESFMAGKEGDWVHVDPNDDVNDFSEDDSDEHDIIASPDGSQGLVVNSHDSSTLAPTVDADGTIHEPRPTAPPSQNKYKLSKKEERALVASAKSALLQRIRSQMKEAMQQGKRDEVVKFVQLLAKVQDSKASPRAASSSPSIASSGEACTSYVQWICDNALKELTAKVDGELKTLKGAKNTEQSHLAAASAALDHVVATLECEEGFVTEAFGSAGFITLLETLHKRCTSDVVRIIRDYIQTRKISKEGTIVDHQPRANLNEHLIINNAKKLDQTLEEIAHLVCCCHMYMGYVDQRYHEAKRGTAPATTAASSSAAATSKQPAAAYDRSHYSAFVTKDNTLFEAIQELLAIYIPMQREYFNTAASQSLILDQKIIGEFAQNQVRNRLKQTGATDSAQGGGAAGGLFGTLGNLYNTAGGGAGGVNIAAVLDDPAFTFDAPLPDVDFVEDLFYVLRVAVHRAFSTKSNVIASSVLVAATDTVTDTIAKEVLRHLKLRPTDHGPTLRGTPQALGTLLASSSLGSAGIKGGLHGTQHLQQLFNDLHTGQNLYSHVIWLTQQMIDQDRPAHKSSSYLDVDPMTMLPIGRSTSHTMTSPSAGAAALGGAAEASSALHAARLYKWVAAAFSMCSYLRKLGKDIEGLTQQYFPDSKTDAVRFREQRHELEATAFWLDENVKLAFRELCVEVADTQYVSRKLLEGFLQTKYDITEDEFNRLEQLSVVSPSGPGGNFTGLMASPRSAAVNNVPSSLVPWVPSLLATWSTVTKALRAQLSQREEIFELLMNNIVETVANRLEQAVLPSGVLTPAADGSDRRVMVYPHTLKTMTVNDFGALAFDKEIRQIRGFFLNAVEGNVPVRERFARLSAIATLLLVDRIQDIPDVCNSVTCLSGEEKKRVFLLKVTLPPAEVKALKF